MNIQFYKYQGTGNDFIMIDNLDDKFNLETLSNKGIIKQLCDRRFGIGADGLIAIEKSHIYDFTMRYFNSDGKESTMCGNGARCIVSFAYHLGIIQQNTTFEAIGKEYKGKILNKEIVSIQMPPLKKRDIEMIDTLKGFLNTGSPHYVEIVPDIESIDVYQKGKKIRYSEPFKDIGGTNVNFIQQIDKHSFKLRTYERGVEDLTMACGTGALAASLFLYHIGMTTQNDIKIFNRGGELRITFSTLNDIYDNLYLTGEAKQVFKGEINIL